MRINSGYARIRRYIYTLKNRKPSGSSKKMLAVVLYPSLFRREPACGACRKNAFVGALEGTTNFCRSQPPKFFMFLSFEGLFTASRWGSLWRAVVSLLTVWLTGRALIAFLTLQPFKRVLFVFFYNYVPPRPAQATKTHQRQPWSCLWWSVHPCGCERGHAPSGISVPG